MRNVFAAAAAWAGARTAFALATLVDVRNAAPAPLGASMAVTIDGKIVGDIGAGCYESEIVEAAMTTASDGIARVLDLDLTSDDIVLGSNGCGGFLRVVTWKPASDFARTAAAIVAGRSDAGVTISYDYERNAREFTATFPARRELIIVGGTTLAQEIASIAARLDFRTIVVDPRPSFATPERLSAVDEIIVAWPEDALPGMLTARTPLLVISHDPKLDIPALRAGLASETPYIGLLGSRRARWLGSPPSAFLRPRWTGSTGPSVSISAASRWRKPPSRSLPKSLPKSAAARAVRYCGTQARFIT